MCIFSNCDAVINDKISFAQNNFKSLITHSDQVRHVFTLQIFFQLPLQLSQMPYHLS